MSDLNDLNRRQFLATTATAAAAAAAFTLPVLPARADNAPTSAPSGNQYDVGTADKYSKDGVTSTWANKNKGAFFIIRDDGKIYASSSLCTHRRCVLTAKPDELYCHCHQSEFSLEGTVTNGPAKHSLERYAISTNADNHIIVDKSTSFSETQWDDPKSFLKAT